MTVRRLGCADNYTARVDWRGGARTFIDLQDQLSSLKWERRLDATSEATVEIPKPLAGDECCRLLGFVRPWVHELTIFRDNELVWQGPIVTTRETRGLIILEAKDVTAWLDRRINFKPYARTSKGLDVVATARDYVRDAFGPRSYISTKTVRGKPTTKVKKTIVSDPNILPFLRVYPGGSKAKRPRIRAKSAYIGSLIRELAKQGLDFTAVGRTIILRPEVSRTTTPIRKSYWLTDEHFTEPIEVYEDGWSIATRVEVLGAGRDPEEQTGCGKRNTASVKTEKPKKPKNKAAATFPDPSQFPDLTKAAADAGQTLDGLPLVAATVRAKSKNGGTAEDLIAEAAKHIGCSESDNCHCKFNRWYGLGCEQPWCDMFLSYCAAQANVLRAVGKFSYTVSHARWFKDKGRWGKKPKRGAIVFFDWGGSGSISAIDHVGIVTKVLSGGRIQTIEGNTSNTVARRVRGGSEIVGYGYPDYPGGYTDVADTPSGGTDGGCQGKTTKQKPLVVINAAAVDEDNINVYGLLDALIKVDNKDNKLRIKDLQARAARHVLQAEPPRIVLTVPQGAVLTPDAPVDISDLVCGWRFDLAVENYCRPLWQPMRLSEVSVEWTSDKSESVRVAFVPLKGAGDIPSFWNDDTGTIPGDDTTTQSDPGKGDPDPVAKTKKERQKAGIWPWTKGGKKKKPTRQELEDLFDQGGN